MRPALTTLLLAAGLMLGCTSKAQERPVPPGMAAAFFAGGCFWCMEQDLSLIHISQPTRPY